MAIAAFAANLRADHPVAGVLNVADVFRVEGLVEAGPSRAGFELGAGAEQRQSAQPAAVNTVLLVVQKAAAKRGLSTVVQQDSSFLGGQLPGESVTLRGAERVNFVA